MHVCFLDPLEERIKEFPGQYLAEHRVSYANGQPADIPGDTESGKRTLAVRIGDGGTRWLYVAMLVVAFASIPIVAGDDGRPAAAAALVGGVLAREPVVRVLEGAAGPALIPVLDATGRVQLISGSLLAAGLWLSA